MTHPQVRPDPAFGLLNVYDDALPHVYGYLLARCGDTGLAEDTFTVTIPEGTPAQAVEDTKAREAERAYELARQGHLLRLWALPGEGRSLGLWRAQDAAEMQAILKSLPLDAWMTVQTRPLTRHPSDPATAKT